MDKKGITVCIPFTKRQFSATRCFALPPLRRRKSCAMACWKPCLKAVGIFAGKENFSQHKGTKDQRVKGLHKFL
jgi:hypothetical protein